MSDSLLRDLSLQLILILLIGVVFLLAVLNSADPEQFFLRYYTKDTGTIVSALYAAPGEVELRYAELHPDHPVLFSFTPNAVLTAPATNTTKVTWRVRQGYGQAREPDRPLAVTPTVLNDPGLLVFRKAGAAITINQDAARCPGAENATPRTTTRLVLAGDDELLAALRAFPLINELEQPKPCDATDTCTVIELTLARGEPGLTLTSDDDAHDAAKLACLLSDGLGRLPVTNTPAPAERRLALALTTPAPKGTDPVPKAVALALDTFTED